MQEDKKPPLSDLGLSGDMDDIELLNEVERVFDVKFGDEELLSAFTVGEMFDLLKQKIGSNDLPGKCRSAMTFFRLRHVLQSHNPEKLKVSTPMTSLNTTNLRSLFTEIEQRTSLQVPHSVSDVWFSRTVIVLAALAFGAALVGLVVIGVWAFIAGVGMTALLFVYLAKGPLRWISNSLTVGQFAEMVANENYTKLSRDGARQSPSELWQAFAFCVAQQTDLDASRIAPSTKFFADAAN